MGNLFGSSSPKPTAPPAPTAPVQEAEFQPGGDDEGSRKKLKTMAKGKRKLQIPLTKTAAKKAVQTGGSY